MGLYEAVMGCKGLCGAVWDSTGLYRTVRGYAELFGAIRGCMGL